jgi:uridine kinase
MCDHKLYIYIETLLKTKKRVVIAIDGQACAGKSTCAQQIHDQYGGSIIHMDDFFLRREMRTQERLNEIGGHVDYERFQETVISMINQPSIEITPYDCHLNVFKPTKKIYNNKLLIIEGAYALRKEWQKYYDVKIVLTIDEVLQKNRILKRDGDVMLNQFIHEWIPRENAYLNHHKIKEVADFIFHTGLQ